VTRRAAIVLAALAAALLAAAPAQARPAKAAADGRPNILVVMTDDQAVADVALMPNVKKLLAARGTTFADAIDSYPLCCPARATFITGQYAHNHDVEANFYPYGWYGMKDRGNTLPAWLQKAGYRTALIGKWLNGYGSRDGKGEVPKGFDIWRGLLDVSAYDYHNFVMNRNGKLKTWGDPVFARKLVEFADIQVTPQENPGLQNVLRRLREVFGDGPYSYWGKQDPQDYSPDVTGAMTADLVEREKSSKKPFFIWWSPAAPHREDVATTLMRRPGRDPRPPARYEEKSAKYKLPRPPSFNEPDVSDKPSNLREGAPELSESTIEQLQLDYEGRAGSLLAVDDHVKKLVSVLSRTGQLSNTLIVFLSDNGWLQGEHRVPGDKYLPYEESLRVPFILRGPGVPAGRVVKGQVANVDFAPTLLDAARAKPGRTQDGVSLLPATRRPSLKPDRAISIEALERLFPMGDFGPFNAWDRPYTGVRTDRYTYVLYNETGERELYDRHKDPHQLRNVAPEPAYASVMADLEQKRRELRGCRGRACDVAQ
jgi:N-acetylglucosamine-6-sulfatase